MNYVFIKYIICDNIPYLTLAPRVVMVFGLRGSIFFGTRQSYAQRTTTSFGECVIASFAVTLILFCDRRSNVRAIGRSARLKGEKNEDADTADRANERGKQKGTRGH